jgi:hypothetical protein
MIQKKAVIVRFNVSSYTARKQDKAVQARVEREAGAKVDTVNVSKRLIGKDAKAYKDVEQKARAYHYEVTLPFGDNGDRLLPVALVPQYTAKMDGYKVEFERAAQEFCREFPQLVTAAMMELGDLWRRDDFPNTWAISSKFNFSFAFSPVPESGHLIIDAAQEVVEDMRRSISESVVNLERQAIRSIHERLFYTLAALFERVSKSDAIFRDSLIGNMQEVVELSGALNFAGDEKLENYRARLAEMLQGIEPETLRESRRIREQVANKAELVLNEMGAELGLNVGSVVRKIRLEKSGDKAELPESGRALRLA